MLGAGHSNKRLQGFFDALLCWALKECESQAEIYENQHLSGSQVLSVEIIGEKFREKIYPQSVQFLQHELITSEFKISKIFLKIKI
jgi:hypothetical protein